MIPLKGSFVQSHRDSCSNSRILLMAKISHLIIDDVLFFPLRNVTSQTKYAPGRRVREEAPLQRWESEPRSALTGPPCLHLCAPKTQGRRDTGRPHSAMSWTSPGKRRVLGEGQCFLTTLNPVQQQHTSQCVRIT